jgi:uncharacterized protein YbjT (DUF2867 family)
MDDRESLRAAMRGAYGIFSVQPALIPPTFAENELQRGLNVADAAHEAGIAHVVYSSVAGANRRTGIPFTMLRPTLFMDMHADATYGVTGELSLVRSLPSNANVQHIAIADVAAFTALALANPSHYLGKALELAGDDVDRRPSPHRDRPCQRTL